MSPTLDGGDESINPYAAPQASLSPEPALLTGDVARAEAIRRRHLNHEANIKSVGQLHLLAAVLLGLMVFAGLSTGRTVRHLEVVYFVVPIVVNFALGFGLYKLQAWARWTEAAMIGVALPALTLAVMFQLATTGLDMLLPVGAGVGAFIPAVVLWLLVSRQGSVVFSPEYREIIRITPHVRYRTSCAAVVALVLIVSFILFSLIGFTGRR